MKIKNLPDVLEKMISQKKGKCKSDRLLTSLCFITKYFLCFFAQSAFMVGEYPYNKKNGEFNRY